MKRITKMGSLVLAGTLVFSSVGFAAEGDHYIKPDYELKYNANQVRADRTAADHVRAVPKDFKMEVSDKLYELTEVNKFFRQDKDNWKDLITGETPIEDELKVESVSAIDANNIKVTFEGVEEPVEIELEKALVDGDTKVSFVYKGINYEDIELDEPFVDASELALEKAKAAAIEELKAAGVESDYYFNLINKGKTVEGVETLKNEILKGKEESNKEAKAKKALAAAKAAVEKAEESELLIDKSAAQELVDELIDSDAKEDLQVRLDEIEVNLTLGEKIAEAEKILAEAKDKLEREEWIDSVHGGNYQEVLRARKVVEDAEGKLQELKDEVTKNAEEAVEDAREKLVKAEDKLEREEWIDSVHGGNYQEVQRAKMEVAKAKKVLVEAIEGAKTEETKEVEALINELPEAEEITLDNKKAVESARKAFDALTTAQQALVDNLEALTTAETELKVLEAQLEAQTELDKVEKPEDSESLVKQAIAALQTSLNSAETFEEVKTVRNNIDEFVQLAKDAAEAGKTLDEILGE